MANNVRLPTDAEAGKRPGRRLGDTRNAGHPIMLTVAVAAPVLYPPIPHDGWHARPLVVSIRPSILMIEAKTTTNLSGTKMTGLFSILYALLFTVGVIL